MITCLWVLFAFCAVAFIFLFIGVCEAAKDFDKQLLELEKKVNYNADDIRALQNACREVKATIENLCNSFNAMLEHNNDICYDMDEYDKQLEQMGEALEKHICDCQVIHRVDDIQKEIDELKPIIARLPVGPSDDQYHTGCDCIIDDTNYDEEDVYHE